MGWENWFYSIGVFGCEFCWGDKEEEEAEEEDDVRGGCVCVCVCVCVVVAVVEKICYILVPSVTHSFNPTTTNRDG